MDKIEVTQDDKDAAASLMSDVGLFSNVLTAKAVQAFARHRLATRTDATPVAWMPMTSSPADEPILAAIKVNHKNGTTWWERHIIVIDSETGTISDMDFHHGWEAEDYEFWQPLPSAPDATYTHPPATDVAALVEAAKAVLPFMAQMRGGMCMKIDGKIVDAGSAHHALSAALAPFTKGQNDDAVR